ncbi:MAG: tRNA (adenosine(37)-N6)-threonylcarbamoyltransferase complex dimerization subunit type 1 TsaB [Planctomycetaceae bacterium]|jgi:tRNA threonylcarbamoyladenosine biosynthesis protein TsaB|nr:tRNA (adenosine(37)-N6)-threonylcarbamoyltransferase complex dimerization subunit type 1 TsaB [Planctomycetaceae bacterium]
MILAIETTERFGSAALLDGNNVLAQVELPKDKRSSQTLHPAIEELFTQSGTLPNDITVLAVVNGPGSFTGLRVGVTAAKVFAYACGAEIIAVSTFDAVKLETSAVHSIGVDAQRGEVVVSLNGEPAQLMSVADWQKQREKYDHLVFTGPALERYAAQMPPDAVLADERYWFPKAEAAGRWAAERIKHRQFDNVFTLLPVYSRLSAAEECLAPQRRKTAE